MSYPQLLTPEEKLADAKQRLDIPKIVAICGSTRFMDQMIDADRALTWGVDGESCIVVKPGCDMKTPHPLWANPDEAEAGKARLDALHKAKIRLASEVLVVGDYVGDSTISEIEYARSLGIPVQFTHPEVDPDGIATTPFTIGGVKTVEEVDAFVASAHAGQFDKIGVPYVEHVRAVAAGLAAFGPDLKMAGLLHDVIEDTDWTADRLRAAGIPDRVVRVVESVSNTPGVPYEEKIRRITSSREATLVKIADNAHNSRPDRAAQLPEEKRARLAAKYRTARTALWTAVSSEDVAAIVSVVNPSLLVELHARNGEA